MARDYNSAEFQKFLDEQQYSRNGILRYEKIFGEDFVSTGGITTTKVRFDLKILMTKLNVQYVTYYMSDPIKLDDLKMRLEKDPTFRTSSFKGLFFRNLLKCWI